MAEIKPVKITAAKRRKRAVTRADKEFSLFIRARDGRCVNCGSVERKQCGHLFTRAMYPIRWDPENAFCQCAGCNFRHEHDPGPLTIYYLNRFGEERYEALHKKGRTPHKFTTLEIEEIADHFRKEREALDERHQYGNYDRKPDGRPGTEVLTEWIPGTEFFDSE